MSDDEGGVVRHVKRYNDRTLSLGMYWWATFTDMARNKLYCIHDRTLTQICKECVENND